MLEIFHLHDLANFQLTLLAGWIGAALGPLDGFLKRVTPPDPVAGDQFLCFGEGAVNHDAFVFGELRAHPWNWDGGLRRRA